MAERREAEAAATGAAATDREVARLDRPPRRNVLAKALVGVLGLMLLSIAALARRPRTPELAASCTTPAFALASPAKQNRPLAFTMVGPSDRLYALGLDSLGFVREGGTWRAVRKPDSPEPVYAAPARLADCRRTGVLNVAVPPGEHTVSMYELTEDQGAVEVRRQTVEVIAPEDEDFDVPGG
ncbi:MAG TPA: hypothetical protein VF519_19050 [Mycobacteriales bacterium]|jgi:hypothetical protein